MILRFYEWLSMKTGQYNLLQYANRNDRLNKLLIHFRVVGFLALRALKW